MGELAIAAVIIASAYTNHVGNVVSGVPVSLSRKEVVISNAEERVSYPLSIFPAGEQRRIAAEYAELTGDIIALKIPTDIRHAIDGAKKSMARSRKRAAAGLCTEEESRDFIDKTRAALSHYLDGELANGRLIPAEHKLLKDTR